MENLTPESIYSLTCILFILGILALGFLGAPLLLWTAWAAVPMILFKASVGCWIAFGVIAAVLNIKPLRRLLITSWLMKIMSGMMPKISDTERAALQAGDVWVEQELFSGKPNFKKLMDQKYPQLTAEEQAFIDGPVAELCKMTNDWEVTQKRDISPQAWEFIKKHRFWSMIIPKEYGGLEFSALAQSEVLMRLATRSVPLCITVMVPNSLGPAELLLHYGTDEQKKYMLPRLARGEEIPCFALTEPNAGSDAASISSNGTVFKGQDGKLYLRLNWDKRYITLAAVSTILGLAFRLFDPENLLGKGKSDLGITCALVPTKTPGVTANRRHDPLSTPFYNCPTQGKDVVVPIDAIIGGPEMAGKGWEMLMACLAAGRGISLPAQSTAAAHYCARIAGAYSSLRKQFGMSIGRFEGIVEPLARIGGSAYLFEAGRKYTLGAIDSGSKPPVITAIAKYYFTEMQRKVVNDAMDILGGKAISRGPHNLIANGYFAIPVSITVEGANILTRTLIIFGQGALRAHPYAFKEVEAVENKDLPAFDSVFFGHIGHIVRNGFRSVLLSMTRGWLSIPHKGGITAKYWRRLAWASASFALMSDIAMGTLGGQLKAKGKTTGRFADILAHMYLATACLRRFEEDGRKKEDEPFFIWSMDHCFGNIQSAFTALFANFDGKGIGWLIRGPIAWWSNLNPMGSLPSDGVELKIASLLQKPGEQRDRISGHIYLPKEKDESLNQLETAFLLTIQTDALFSKISKAVKAKKLKKGPAAQLHKDAVAAGVITQEEYNQIAQAETARAAVVKVDDFGLDEYKANR
jgi:acyl-CoA dehydrogenase